MILVCRWTELLDNATDAGATVIDLRLHSLRNNGGLLIQLQDNGCGSQKHHRRRRLHSRRPRIRAFRRGRMMEPQRWRPHWRFGAGLSATARLAGRDGNLMLWSAPPPKVTGGRWSGPTPTSWPTNAACPLNVRARADGRRRHGHRHQNHGRGRRSKPLRVESPLGVCARMRPSRTGTPWQMAFPSHHQVFNARDAPREGRT